MSSIFATLGILLLVNSVLLIAACAKRGRSSLSLWKLDERTPFNKARKYFARLMMAKYDALL